MKKFFSRGYYLYYLNKVLNLLGLSVWFIPNANKYFVEKMIDEKYDYLYDQSLFCEARLRILANLTQTKIVQEKEIHIGALEGEEIPAECFHPVKSKIK